MDRGIIIRIVSLAIFLIALVRATINMPVQSLLADNLVSVNNLSEVYIHPFLGLAISIILWGLSIFLIQADIRYHKLFELNTNAFYLALSFIFLLVPDLFWNALAAIQLFLISMIIRICWRFFQIGFLYKELAIASVLAAIACVFHPIAFFYLPFMIIALSMLKPFNLREMVYLWVLFFIPFLYLFSLIYVFDGKIEFQAPMLTLEIGNFSELTVISYVLFTIVSLISMFYFFSEINKAIIRIRNQVYILFNLFAIAVLLWLGDEKTLAIALAALPLAFSIGVFYRIIQRKWLLDVVLGICLLTYFLI